MYCCFKKPEVSSTNQDYLCMSIPTLTYITYFKPVCYFFLGDLPYLFSKSVASIKYDKCLVKWTFLGHNKPHFSAYHAESRSTSVHREQLNREAAPHVSIRLQKFCNLFLFLMEHRKHEIAGIAPSHLWSKIWSTVLNQTTYKLKIHLN